MSAPLLKLDAMSFIYTPLEMYRDKGWSDFLRIYKLCQNHRRQEGKMRGEGRIYPRIGDKSPEGGV